ncbi:ISL3 family transposase, partial [Escherichia coli]
MINSLSLPGYQLVDSDEQNEDIHFRLEAPTPVACEGCGVQGEFVRFDKRDVPYRD